MFRLLAAALAVALILPATVTALHLGSFAVMSLFFRRPRRPSVVEPVRFLVVVPAHNEELVLADTLSALRASMRPRDQVLVVDDRSTDRTSEIALEFGAVVLRREPHEEPGRAAARQAAIDHAASLEWDAMVMIDADSIVASDFFDRCEVALAGGAKSLQARSEAAIGERIVDQAAIASFAIQGVMLPRGREVVGLPVRLRGTGMVLRRELMSLLDFRARASEDLQVSLDLIRHGIRTRHVDDARMRSANAGSWKVASTQKQRYEAGRMAATRHFVPQLLRIRSAAALESVWFLISPPFAVAVGFGALGTLAGLLATSRWLVIAGLTILGLLALAFVIAVIEARAGWRMMLAVLVAPGYILWKLIVQVKALLTLRGGLKEFGATPRDG